MNLETRRDDLPGTAPELPIGQLEEVLELPFELQPEEDITPVVLPYFPARATSWVPYFSAEGIDCTCATYPHIAQCGVTIREGGFRLQLSQQAIVWEQRLNPNGPGYVILFRQDFETNGYTRNFATAIATFDAKVGQVLRFHTLDEARNSFFARCLSDREVLQQESGYELLSVHGKALWDALYDDNNKHHDNAFLEPAGASFCAECGRNLDWSHAEDCASGAADRILSGDYSDIFDN